MHVYYIFEVILIKKNPPAHWEIQKIRRNNWGFGLIGLSFSNGPVSGLSTAKPLRSWQLLHGRMSLWAWLYWRGLWCGFLVSKRESHGLQAWACQLFAGFKNWAVKNAVYLSDAIKIYDIYIYINIYIHVYIHMYDIIHDWYKHGLTVEHQPWMNMWLWLTTWLLSCCTESLSTSNSRGLMNLKLPSTSEPSVMREMMTAEWISIWNMTGDMMVVYGTVDGSEIRLTSWYGKYPIVYRVSYMSGGAGFLPSTVVSFAWITLHDRTLWRTLHVHLIQMTNWMMNVSSCTGIHLYIYIYIFPKQCV